MLHIVLLILKIIGIIIGVLLAVILLGICLALFVPIRYKVDAKRIEGDGNPPAEVSVKVTWLLHTINIKGGYSTEFWMRIRIFFFTVFQLPKKPKKEKAGKNKKGKTREKTKVKRVGKQKPCEKQKTVEKKTAVINEDLRMPENNSKGNKIAEKSVKTTKKQSKISIKERIARWITKICRFFQNIWYTITGICDKIKKIRENIEYYWNVLQSETCKQSYSLCKEELAGIFSYIKPRKFQADLVIGTGDPASTAKILSYYGMLYPFIGKNVNITPDFDEKKIEGLVHIKGKIRLFTFIKAAIRVYFSKDIRKLLKLFKKEET